MPIRQVVLDFDGTCTDIPPVHQAFLEAYRDLVGREWSAAALAVWEEAEAAVRAASPRAAWMLGGAPAAPAAADPYIVASEAVAYIERSGRAGGPPPASSATWYKRAYLAHPAPWRPEAAELLRELVGLGLRVAFVSNSAPDAIGARLDELALPADLRAALFVVGNAGKFRVRELTFERAPPLALAADFLALAAAAAPLPDGEPGRPIYLRRGAYFEALCAVWTHGGALLSAGETLICGDVWELDLAMPAALGAHVHLITRDEPYATCAYERAAALASPRGAVSDDLQPVLERVKQHL